MGRFGQPYITLSNDYIESVWWVLKQLGRKTTQRGHKVQPYCTRCGTPLRAEVAQGYQTVTDPSIYVKFPLQDDPIHHFWFGQPGPFLLMWRLLLELTTTMLPLNTKDKT